MPWTDVSQLQRGDVVLVRFPFTDLGGSKVRPAILVTDTAAMHGPDGHFIFIGSQPPPPDVVSLRVTEGSAEAVSMGLRFNPGSSAAFLQPTKVATLEVGLVVRRLGRVSPSLLGDITKALRATLGL